MYTIPLTCNLTGLTEDIVDLVLVGLTEELQEEAGHYYEDLDHVLKEGLPSDQQIMI